MPPPLVPLPLIVVTRQKSVLPRIPSDPADLVVWDRCSRNILYASEAMNWLPTVAHTAIRIFQTVCSTISFQKEDAQLFEMAAVFVAFKYENDNIEAKMIPKLLQLITPKRTEDEFVQVEIIVCETLGWRIDRHSAMGSLYLMADRNPEVLGVVEDARLVLDAACTDARILWRFSQKTLLYSTLRLLGVEDMDDEMDEMVAIAASVTFARDWRDCERALLPLVNLTSGKTAQDMHLLVPNPLRMHNKVWLTQMKENARRAERSMTMTAV